MTILNPFTKQSAGIIVKVRLDPLTQKLSVESQPRQNALTVLQILTAAQVGILTELVKQNSMLVGQDKNQKETENAEKNNDGGNTDSAGPKSDIASN